MKGEGSGLQWGEAEEGGAGQLGPVQSWGWGGWRVGSPSPTGLLGQRL